MKPVTQPFSARELHHWLSVQGWQLAVERWERDLHSEDAPPADFDFDSAL